MPRRRRDVLVITAGLLAGIGASVFADDALDLFRGDDGAVVASPVADADLGQIDDVLPTSSDDVAATPAPSPSEAVERFLAAESKGDHAGSFTLLSAAGRETYGSPAAWRASHASFFPVLAFEVVGVNDAGSQSSVVTDVRYESTLDEVIGLVPARAEVTWPVVEEDGGWLVDFDAAEITPAYPPEDEAADAARRWASRRQDCRPAEEYAAGLVGFQSLAEQLCGADGRLRYGPVSPLDSGDTSALVSAFGAPAASWARAVSISGPVDLSVVLAPVDGNWLVVGVLDAP